MILQLSHSANNDQDWFIVKPLIGETVQSILDTPITNAMAVKSLIEAGRRVIEINTDAASAIAELVNP